MSDNDDAPAGGRPETDGQIAARHARELGAILDDHRAGVAKIHAAYPTPAARHHRGDRDGWWAQFTSQEKRRWNEKQRLIAAANRVYSGRVRAAVLRHQREDHNLNTPAVVAAGLAAAKILKTVKNQRRAAR